MFELKEKVSAETRWTTATQSMTSAVMATNKVLLDIVGREKYNEIIEKIWSAGGKASKQVADNLDLNGNDAISIAETVLGIAMLEMGPDFKFEPIETSEEKATIKCIECPWANRVKELGISDDLCSVGDPAWGNGLAKAINPKINITLTKAVPRGDAHCEWVYELEK